VYKANFTTMMQAVEISYQ